MGGENWSQTIKECHNSMSIDDAARWCRLDSCGESATFLLAMGGIGGGLAAFGIGSAIGGARRSSCKFAGGTDWRTS